jgi:hypothetical protein
MGNCQGCIPAIKNKNNKINIKDFKKVIIPKEYELIKIITYNANLKNSINLENKVKNVISIIFDNFKNKSMDIICLQGVNDYPSAFLLIQSIKTKMSETNDKFYFFPEFDEVNIKQTSVDTLQNAISDSYSTNFNKYAHKRTISWDATLTSRNLININVSDGSNERNKRTKSQNIIISKYPIISSLYAEIDDDTDFNDIVGTNTIIAVNISISGNIISVYNTTLIKDIKSAHIINSHIRTKELQIVFNIIKRNELSLKNEEFSTFVKTDIHLLLGSININETDNDSFNNEYTRFIEKKHCVDIYRYFTNTELGLTTTTRERLNYIFMLLTDDIYDENHSYNKKLQNISDASDLFDFLFDRYGIYFLDTYVRTDICTGGGQNDYPVENVFIINKNKH